MKSKRRRILRLFILLLLAVATLSACGRKNTRAQKAVAQFAELVERGELGDLSLSIYYPGAYTLTPYPWSTDDIMQALSGDEIVITDSRLEEYVDVFRQLNADAVVQAEQESYLDARLYYVFSKGSRIVLEVAMWGQNRSIFVNGLEIKENAVFYDIVIPFLPQEAAGELREYLLRL